MYYKMAYESCVRNKIDFMTDSRKANYMEAKELLNKQPSLRFKMGDEVEVLNECDHTWKNSQIVKFYYPIKDYEFDYTPVYRIQCFDEVRPDGSPVYAWTKADLDRYVRKVGIRSIEDTRYQVQLAAKVEELASVYCSKKFMQDIYHTLAQDREFVEMLQSVWQIELSETMLYLYRMLVVYRQPFIPVESGYHIPTAEEVIAGIEAYFDPANRIGDSAPAAEDEDSYSEGVRALLSEDIYTRAKAYFDPSNRGIDSAGSGDEAHVHPVQAGPCRPVNEYAIKMLRTLDFPVTALTILKNIPYLDIFFSERLSYYVQLYSLDWSRRLDSGPTVDLTTLIENGFSIPHLRTALPR